MKKIGKEAQPLSERMMRSADRSITSEGEEENLRVWLRWWSGSLAGVREGGLEEGRGDGGPTKAAA
jgi:hypothetical protein